MSMSANRGESFDRRGFVKIATAGMAAGAASTALGTRHEASASETSLDARPEGGKSFDVLTDTPSFLEPPAVPTSVAHEMSCDVLVIGAGTSGNPAARAAAEAGANVIAIDKGADLGYVPSSQDFGVVGSKLQEQLGIEWEPKNVIVKQLMKDMYYRPNPRLLNYWYENSGAAFDWAIDGVDYQLLKNSVDEPTQEIFIRPKMFPALDGYDYHEEYYPYFHGTLMTLPSSQWVMQNCVDKAQAAGAQFIYGMYAEQLITDADGAVVGAYAHDVDGNYTKFNAKAVILTCGDMAGNKEMLTYYAPQASQFTVFYSRMDSQGNPANTGDGHRMAIWAGASMELGPYAPMTHHVGGPLGVDAFLQLNSQGERFMNEDVPGQNIQDQLSRQPGGYSWQIVDDNWRDELEAQGTGHGYVNHYLSDEEAAKKPWIMDSVFLGYVTDDVFLNGDPAHFKQGITCQADTIEELAEKMGLSADVVVAQIDRYNELCDKGEDEDFGKDSRRMFRIDEPPFSATKFEQTSMLVCPGGIKCDLDLHALTADDRVVPGLYVAGNNMGGRFLVEYPVTVAGISLGTALTFGKLAGENAAREALEK
ncbi:MAG: FAD-dependent oxidoreductase [Coriobacteriales bacterium]|jgi:fumarate reductase flavoprotein subunit